MNMGSYRTVSKETRQIDPQVERRVVRRLDAIFHLTPDVENADPVLSRPDMPHQASFRVPNLPEENSGGL
jgi:hypothetical protein